MKIEKLRKSHKNKIILGGLISLGVIGAITILPSHAKYRLTDSINIANGVVNYKVPDFNVLAMYKSDDGTNYTEITDRMPDSGYIINEEKSYCNLNGTKDANAILKTINGDHVIANLIKGDKCYLYFDKKVPTASETILASITVKDTAPDFTQTATTDEGVYAVADGMYGGTSYYFRGATANNYIKFAGFCWRIVRINGDGSIRLIYDGTTCHANGTSTAESIVLTDQPYTVGAVANRNEYVGYTYTQGLQRGTATASNLKIQTEEWYTTNISNKGYDGKVATGKFCNDRNAENGYFWSSTPDESFYYAGNSRSGANNISIINPILDCTNSNDIYILKTGSITMDEIIIAGGKWNTVNKNYYLYNGQEYWTMSPSGWGWIGQMTNVFIADNDGSLKTTNLYNSYSIRPIINLLSTTQFKSGTDGTLNNPYEVI